MAHRLVHVSGSLVVPKKETPLKLGHRPHAHIALKKLRGKAGPHSVAKVRRPRKAK